MAIGGVLSNRSFGSFLSPGDFCKKQSDIARLRKVKFGFSIGLYGLRLPRYSLSPNSSHRTSTLQSLGGKVDKFLVDNKNCLLRVHVRNKTTRAYYKSEEFDITDATLESLRPPQGASEVVLPEGNAKTVTSWLDHLPKRWVIVLLCFVAFLLCNMDRVNMSIAILPMSKEFNWNSITVGLIQSSFFWGYLLTQIAGGIWADKVGGKLVLGFGVIWWSLATVLTPLAARISLPCLLAVRAFMGIGEVGLKH